MNFKLNTPENLPYTTETTEKNKSNNLTKIIQLFKAIADILLNLTCLSFIFMLGMYFGLLIAFKFLSAD